MEKSSIKTKFYVVKMEQARLMIRVPLDKQTEVVNDQEFKLQEELEQAREEEQGILNDITEKYGPGQLDPQSGVFTPTTEIQQSTED